MEHGIPASVSSCSNYTTHELFSHKTVYGTDYVFGTVPFPTRLSSPRRQDRMVYTYDDAVQSNALLIAYMSSTEHPFRYISRGCTSWSANRWRALPVTHQTLPPEVSCEAVDSQHNIKTIKFKPLSHPFLRFNISTMFQKPKNTFAKDEFKSNGYKTANNIKLFAIW